MSHRIGEIAKEAGVTVEAIRYYERIGLLPEAPRTGAGTRRYAPDAVARIRFVKQAQSNGFTLAEIRKLLGLSARPGAQRCRQVRELLTGKLREIDERRAQLDEFRRTLQQYAEACEESLRQSPAPDCPVLSKLGHL